jgi:ribonuclease HI
MWINNGWRTADKKPVANMELWKELLKLTGVHDVTWEWVRGHTEDELNNRFDALAVKARKELAKKLSQLRLENEPGSGERFGR